MAERDNEPRLISADRPINRRTAPPELRADAAPGAEAIARIERIHARHLLGPSLQQKLRADQAPLGRRIHGMQIVGAICTACGALMLLLAAIGSSASWALAGTSVAVAGIGLLLLWRRRTPQSAAPYAQGTAVFDDEALRRFDELLERCACDLSEAARASLLGLKDSLARIGAAAGALPPDAHFTVEDRMFVHECLRRYVPDSLAAYLAVPAAQREAPLASTATSAEALLLEQFALLQAELAKREQALGRRAAEALLLQQRFLEGKRTSP